MLETYIPGFKSNGQFFSTLLPQELLGEIKLYLEDKKCKIDVLDQKKYKLKATIKSLDEVEEEQGSDDEEEAKKQEQDDESVKLSVKVLQVEGEKKYCVEFNRIDGDSLIYYQLVQRIRDDLADLANA